MIILQRTVLTATFTMGELTVEDELVGYTLEDPVREAKTQRGWVWDASFKIPKHTAIPSGKYRVVNSMSTRFRRVLPEVLRVPNFTGIRVHAGNDVGDTEGCPLLGLRNEPGRVWNCAPAVDRLIELVAMLTAIGGAWIEVKNP